MGGLNLYDLGARWYDPLLGRFTTIDPMAEKYYATSPYAYCGNDPVNFVDPLGEEPTAKEAAYIADHVYGKNNKLIGGWHQYYRNSTPNGLQYGVYEREMKNGEMEYVLAFAGTNDMNDVQQDLTQFFNTGAASQYGNAVTLGRKFASYYDGYEKTIVGHSLGGSFATAASMATDIPAITFNPAAMTEYTKSQLGIQNSNGTSITNYVVTGEPLSIVQNKCGMELPGNTNYIDMQKKSNNPFVNSHNAHSISSIKKNPNKMIISFIIHIIEILLGALYIVYIWPIYGGEDYIWGMIVCLGYFSSLVFYSIIASLLPAVRIACGVTNRFYSRWKQLLYNNISWCAFALFLILTFNNSLGFFSCFPIVLPNFFYFLYQQFR